MELLAKRLSDDVKRPIIDRTGLEGAYDFDYELERNWDNWDVVSASLASVQGIGLKLESGKGPVEVLVIDSIAKPAAN
jgi:uncharacterized protein (TIGR03435 family)